jgi:hypothetical protein
MDLRDLPTIYFVQESTTGEHEEGWRTTLAVLDRDMARRYAESFERSDRWIDGRRVTESSVTFARVRTAEEILDEEGEEALIRALMATRVQLEQELGKALPELFPGRE